MTITIDGQAHVICATCHRTTPPTVTYFDPRSQRWIEHATTIPTCALAILSDDEAARVRGHLGMP